MLLTVIKQVCLLLSCLYIHNGLKQLRVAYDKDNDDDLFDEIQKAYEKDDEKAATARKRIMPPLDDNDLRLVLNKKRRTATATLSIPPPPCRRRFS